MRCCSLQSVHGRLSRGGMSLVEMMVAVGVGSIALLAVMQLSMFTSRSFAALGNYADLDRASRNALDNMSRDIRQARVLDGYSTNSVKFMNMDTNSWFKYEWNPSTKEVTRSTGVGVSTTPQTSEVILKGCDYFRFRVWLRNPTEGFWFPYSATAQPALTKLVDVSWKCSRRVISQFNTESVQTAKIVLRN